MSERYMNREIDRKHEDIMDELSDIKKEVKHTNGRVRHLEKIWYLVAGAIAVMGAEELFQIFI